MTWQLRDNLAPSSGKEVQNGGRACPDAEATEAIWKCLVGEAEMFNGWSKLKGLYLNGDREVRTESLTLWPVDNSDRKMLKTDTL